MFSNPYFNELKYGILYISIEVGNATITISDLLIILGSFVNDKCLYSVNLNVKFH